MSQSVGRPKADNPKSVIVKARIDADTRKRLKAYCEQNNMTPTDVLRKGVALILAQSNEEPGAAP